MAEVVVQAQAQSQALVPAQALQALRSPLQPALWVPLELLGCRLVTSSPRSPALATGRVTKQNSAAELALALVLLRNRTALTTLFIDGRGASLMYSSIVARNDGGGCRTLHDEKTH